MKSHDMIMVFSHQNILLISSDLCITWCKPFYYIVYTVYVYGVVYPIGLPNVTSF